MAEPQSIMAQLVSGAAMPLLGVQFSLTNGTVIVGHMNMAELSRIHQYLSENELAHPAQEVTFPAEYLDAPVELHIDMKLTHVPTGWAYVVRNVEAPYMNDGRSFVHVLLVTASQ